MAITVIVLGLGAVAPAWPSQAAPKPWLIRTVAGGVGGPGPARQVPIRPCSVAPAAGGIYVADQVLGAGPVVREISQQTGTLTTPLGDGGPGASADGTPASRADLSAACGLVVDHAGNLLFSQAPIERVRIFSAMTGRFYGRSMKAGDVYTIAGNGKTGKGVGDGGPALQARLNTPGGLAVDAAGNVYIEDVRHGRIRVLAERTGHFFGQAMKAGNMYTIAGNGKGGFSGDGVLATQSGLGLLPGPFFSMTQGVSVDRHGNVIIAAVEDDRVRVVAASSGTFYGQAMKTGFIYTIAGHGPGGTQGGDGGPATAADVAHPQALAIDRSGNVVISQQGDCPVRVVAAVTGEFYGQAMTAGDIYSIGGAAACSSASLGIDRAGNIVTVAIGVLPGSDWVGVLATSAGRFYGRAMIAGGQYAITSQKSPGDVGAGAVATTAEILPQSVAVDSAGDQLMMNFLPDINSPPAQIRLVAGAARTVFGRAVRRGRIYTIGTVGAGQGDQLLQGVAFDKFGNALVSGGGSVDLIAVRDGTFYGQVMRAGHLYPVAGGGSGSGSGVPARSVQLSPDGVTTDSDGNIVIADFYFNDVVRVVAARRGTFYGLAMKAGDIYTIAGTGDMSGFEGNGVPGTESVIVPAGVVVDRAGNIVVTDINDHTVRVIAAKSGKFYGQRMIPGDIYGLAGNGHFGFRGNGIPASAAEFAAPAGVAVDAAGNVLIADSDNCRVRLVAARSGQFYGRAMKAGDIYTVAGSGCLPGQRGGLPPPGHGTGKFADGVSAADAELLDPVGLAVTKSGAVLVTDSFRVRVIAP